MEINWDTKVVELDAKSIDCIWHGMTLTDDLMANTATTKAYATNAQDVYKRQVFMPYTMVKDHRTNYETGKVEAVMDGDLDGVIFAYLKAASRGELQDLSLIHI